MNYENIFPYYLNPEIQSDAKTDRKRDAGAIDWRTFQPTYNGRRARLRKSLSSPY